MEDFSLPWEHSFPPFFTIQPNQETRKKQLEAWRSLVLAYCKHNKKYVIDVTELHSSQLFHNKNINRKLAIDDIYLVLDELNKTGHLEWQDKMRQQCTIMWRSPEEWGKLIYDWISDRSMNNSVCTFYEISAATGQEFHKLDKWLLVKGLRTLEKDGKAEVMEADEGVKFF